MEQLDRMELADIGHPRKMAEGVLRLIPGVCFPLPIDEVALALGIRKIESFDTDAFEGALLTNDTKSNAAILFRAGTIEPRRRYTIGHELGHYLMPLHFPSSGGFQCKKSDFETDERSGMSGRPLWEAQANAFASNLLMPASEFKRRLRLLSGASIEALVSLSDDFGTSKIASGRRLLDMSDTPCAIVVAKDGVIKHLYRAKAFPFISLKAGLRLPRDSLSLIQPLLADQHSDVESTEQCNWLSKDDQEGLELFEQTLCQRDGWTLTLLTADIEDSDDED